jgi:hypothetical protein
MNESCITWAVELNILSVPKDNRIKNLPVYESRFKYEGE